MEQVRRCLSLLEPSGRRQLAKLAAMIFGSSILEMLSVGMIIPFVALMNNPGLIETSRLVHAIYAYLGLTTAQDFLVTIGLCLFLLVLLKNAYVYFVNRSQARFCHRQAARVAGRLLDIYLHAPFKAHLARSSVSFMNTADHAVDQAFSQVMLPFLIFVTEASAMATILLLLLFVEPMLTATLGLVVIASAGLLALVLRKTLSRMGSDAFRLRLGRLQLLQQSLQAIKEIKVFGRETFFLGAFRKVRFGHADVQAAADTLTQSPRQVLEIVIVGGLILVIVMVLAQGRATDEIIAVLGLFSMAAFRVIPGANRLLSAYNAMKHGSAYLNETVLDYFDESLRAARVARSTPPATLRKGIEFDNITFTYEGAREPALDGISLAIERGQSVGLVGTSGAGKSTLVDVMLGLLVPQAGQIIVDDADVTANPAAWHELAGYVPQSVSLIDNSLRNNVAFGVEPDQIDDARIWAALERAHLAEFVRGLPRSLDTELGERGVRISGGQRQRVGIARALYSDPAVLIFDEATAALDNESEHEITRAIEALHGQKTLVIIAHRLSTVRKCDKLIVMKAGSIADSGTFESLIRSCADFRRMVELAELKSGASEFDLALQ